MILIQNLYASRVRLNQNDFAAGLPSPLAFLGLVASLAPQFGHPRWGVGVLPILHEVSPSPGRTRGEIVKDGAGFKSIEIPEDMRGEVRFSLLLDLPDRGARDFERALLGARLAGGVIFKEDTRHGAPLGVSEDGQAFVSSARGRAVLPMKGMPLTRGRGNDIFDLADATYPEQGTIENPGWRVPLAVGYALLEAPSEAPARENLRDPGLPHVFAEPVASVGELVSPRSPRLTDLDASSLKGLMWRYATAYPYVAAHPFYLPKGPQND